MQEETIKRLRKRILEISYKGQDGNLQSVFSALDILWVLYDKVLKCSPEQKKGSNKDHFVLSKGQATLGLFAVLEEKGYYKKEELDKFCQLDSRFAMQADRTKFGGEIENSPGSLGHGYPMAVGMALASKIKGLPSKIYTLVGDGEFNEGTMWEASLFAGARKLDNLTVIIDDNNSVGAMIDMGNMAEKLKSFGFSVIDVDGHDQLALYEALTSVHEGKPCAIIAHTIRGYGSKTMMMDSKWFHRAPNKKELDMLWKEVDEFEKSDV